MKEIFQRKAFWVTLVILFLAIFVYPPFFYHYRYWDWIFNGSAQLDLKMIFAESIMAILVTIGIFMIPFKKINTYLESIPSLRLYLMTALITIIALIAICWGLSKVYRP